MPDVDIARELDAIVERLAALASDPRPETVGRDIGQIRAELRRLAEENEEVGRFLGVQLGLIAPPFPVRPSGYDPVMQIDRDLVIEELRKAGKNEHVEKAIQELPEKIDHNEHAAMLEKFGLDPGKLAEKAAERGLGSL